MTNTQELFKDLDIGRAHAYITINKQRTIIRVMVPGTKVKMFNVKNYRGLTGLKRMVIDAINHRDEMKNQKRVQPSLILHMHPIRELSKKYDIRQSSRHLYSEVNSLDIKSIVIRAYVDGTYINEFVYLKDFEGLTNSPFYHAHYYAAYVRNHSFNLNKLPTEAMKKKALKWALDTTKHKYQHMTDEEYEQAISKYKKDKNDVDCI